MSAGSLIVFVAALTGLAFPSVTAAQGNSKTSNGLRLVYLVSVQGAGPEAYGHHVPTNTRNVMYLSPAGDEVTDKYDMNGKLVERDFVDRGRRELVTMNYSSRVARIAPMSGTSQSAPPAGSLSLHPGPHQLQAEPLGKKTIQGVSCLGARGTTADGKTEWWMCSLKGFPLHFVGDSVQEFFSGITVRRTLLSISPAAFPARQMVVPSGFHKIRGAKIP